MVFGDIICCVVFVGEAIHCVPMHIHCVSMHIHSTNQQSHNTSKPLMLMEPLNALPTETRTPDLSLSWLLVPITETVGSGDLEERLDTSLFLAFVILPPPCPFRASNTLVDRLTFNTPRRPYERERLDQELRICGEYGLRCKREIWRVQLVLAKIRKVGFVGWLVM